MAVSPRGEHPDRHDKTAVVAMIQPSRRLHDFLAWLTRTVLPSRRKQVKQTRAAQELTYLDPPDGVPAGPRSPR
jgi:hypothetical protein